MTGPRHLGDIPMPDAPVIISLPIADRPTSFASYRDGLGLRPVGEAADDGVHAGTFGDPDGHLWMVSAPTAPA